MLHADKRQVSKDAAKGALGKSLLLHVLVLGLVVGLPYLHQPPKVVEPVAMQAVLVQQAVLPQPEVIEPPVEPPPPEPPVLEEVEIPEPVREPPKIALPKKPEKPKKPEPAKVEPKKPILSAEQLKKQMQDQMRQAMREEMQRSLQEEMENSVKATRVSANSAIVNQYMGLINQRVVTKWNRPLSARNGMVVTLRISMLPGGEVVNVVTTGSSGDPAYDASAEAAVRSASPLPVPTDVAVFNQNFRILSLRFNPEDL